MKKLLLILTFNFITLLLNAQIVNPIQWNFDSKQNGRDVDLIFHAVIDSGWHLYDTYLPENGPIPTTFVYTDSMLFDFIGDFKKQSEPEIHFDPNFEMNVGYYSDELTLTQKIRLKTNNQVEIKGYVRFMSCYGDVCTPPEKNKFSFLFNQDKNPDEAKDTRKVMNTSVPESTGGQSIWLFILISVLAGIAAILTPCVFPMVPMTVSFFMRGAENRGKSIRTGIFFGTSIVGIFTLLGALFSIGLFGPNVGNILSTHWIPNLLFFTLFLVFAVSFLGAFEIVLPNSLVNKTDAKSDKGGWTGAFFMALTTVVVSFSCTGPFIGALIIQAVQDGGIRPLIGMFFFGLAFGTPFSFLAIFPSVLSKLPKSGAWLNTIKVVFAFILLAFGLKFLSNIDQVYGFGLISREIYLAIWIVLFFLLGMYFLGKIKFPNDSDFPNVSVGRLFLVIITFTFVLYLFTGLFGAPLRAISSFIPPPSVHPIVMSTSSGISQIGSAQAECGLAKYSDKLHLPNGLIGYFDFEQGMACAADQGKPALVVFKGHTCSNCKRMENSVWMNLEVNRILSENYVVIALYDDDRTKLDEHDWVYKSDGEILKTLGEKNLDIQINNYRTNSIPFHVIIKPDGMEYTMGSTFDNEEFVSFLNKGIL